MLQLASTSPFAASQVGNHVGHHTPQQAALAGQLLADEHSALARWLSQTLDHVGRGMLLVTDGGRVLHANRLARQALDGPHPLRMDQGRLRASNTHDTQALMDALDAAMQRGLRRMLQLSQGGGATITGRWTRKATPPPWCHCHTPAARKTWPCTALRVNMASAAPKRRCLKRCYAVAGRVTLQTPRA